MVDSDAGMVPVMAAGVVNILEGLDEIVACPDMVVNVSVELLVLGCVVASVVVEGFVVVDGAVDGVSVGVVALVNGSYFLFSNGLVLGNVMVSVFDGGANATVVLLRIEVGLVTTTVASSVGFTSVAMMFSTVWLFAAVSRVGVSV